MERMMVSLKSATFDNKSLVRAKKDTNFSSRRVPDDNLKNSSEGRHSNTKPVMKKLDRTSCSTTPLSRGNCDELLNCSKWANSVKTCQWSLVERFEKRKC